MIEGGRVGARWSRVMPTILMLCHWPAQSMHVLRAGVLVGTFHPERLQRAGGLAVEHTVLALKVHADGDSRGRRRPLRECRDMIVQEAVEVL